MKKIALVIILGILLIETPLAVAPSQDMIVEILPYGILVYSPQNQTYSTRMIPVNISMSETANYFKYSDNGGKFRTLSRNCEEYGFSKLKRKPFDDGSHNVTILAVFDEGVVYFWVNFTVDSVRPRIYGTEPDRGFASGLFSVEYREDNPQEMWITYWNLTDKRNVLVNLSECYPRRSKMKCDVIVNLSEFDEQELNYVFNLSDIVGNYDESKERTVKVDVSAPRINYFNYSQSSRRVTFTFNVTEPNFDEINYYDYLEGGKVKWRLLCSKLSDGQCEKTKSFSKGAHNLTIEILDKAGNKKQIDSVIFSV